MPFFLILCVTAAKEIYEDLKRHAADRKENQAKVTVINKSGDTESKKWQDVKVGDLLKISKDKFFPADLVLLASSEPDGMCYVETANLDGETNLKIRSALQQTCDLDGGLKLAETHGLVECEEPNREIYDFKGNITLVWKLLYYLTQPLRYQGWVILYWSSHGQLVAVKVG